VILDQRGHGLIDLSQIPGWRGNRGREQALQKAATRNREVPVATPLCDHHRPGLVSGIGPKIALRILSEIS